MSITSAVSEAVTAISIWLNPERKEKIILRKAIGAAEELIKIYKMQPPYDKLNVSKVHDLEVHYTKRWLAWKDGLS